MFHWIEIQDNNNTKKKNLHFWMYEWWLCGEGKKTAASWLFIRGKESRVFAKSKLNSFKGEEGKNEKLQFVFKFRF